MPPFQWMTSASCGVGLSTVDTTISSMRHRTIRFFSRMSVAAPVHTRGKSSASRRSWARSGGVVQGNQPLFEGLDPSERRVPAPLQCLRDQPMLWLHNIVLASGPLCLVPCLPELQVHRPALGIHFISRGGARGQGRFDSAGTEDP